LPLFTKPTDLVSSRSWDVPIPGS